MIHVNKSKQFERDHSKLPQNIQVRFHERFLLFLENPSHPLLKKHTLHGKYKDFLSINITDDYRFIFQYITKDHILAWRIGTHSQLYK